MGAPGETRHGGTIPGREGAALAPPALLAPGSPAHRPRVARDAGSYALPARHGRECARGAQLAVEGGLGEITPGGAAPAVLGNSRVSSVPHDRFVGDYASGDPPSHCCLHDQLGAVLAQGVVEDLHLHAIEVAIPVGCELDSPRGSFEFDAEQGAVHVPPPGGRRGAVRGRGGGGLDGGEGQRNRPHRVVGEGRDVFVGERRPQSRKFQLLHDLTRRCLRPLFVCTDQPLPTRGRAANRADAHAAREVAAEARGAGGVARGLEIVDGLFDCDVSRHPRPPRPKQPHILGVEEDAWDIRGEN
mmetsp:Transcript_50164/g.160682  ORF Transcript_50164/g.160682 Transcript_50164/m.160682 type:complete len:301 (+) Transcript_50164:1709-2611(+)